MPHQSINYQLLESTVAILLHFQPCIQYNENRHESFSTINPATTEIVNKCTHTLTIDLQRNEVAIVLGFLVNAACHTALQMKNITRSAPATHPVKDDSHDSQFHYVLPQINTYAVVKKGMAHKGGKR